MDIIVVSKHLAAGYSGGRYYSWVVTQALAAEGHSVTLWTDNFPAVSTDFEESAGTGEVNVIVDTSFAFHKRSGEFDVAILVPHGREALLHRLWVEGVRRLNVPFVMLNFESQNWFEAVYGASWNDDDRWGGINYLGKHAPIILSMNKEAVSWAKKMYGENGKTHLSVYPAINSEMAKQYRKCPKGKALILFCRLGDKHKGGRYVGRIFCEELRGSEVKIVVGSGWVPEHLQERWQLRAKVHGMSFEILQQITDDEKFYEIACSSCLVYLSAFEGYGYPPLEALYVGTSVVAFDLPVLRETCGKLARFVPQGDMVRVVNEVKDILGGAVAPRRDKVDMALGFVEFEVFSGKLSKLLTAAVGEVKGNYPRLDFRDRLSWWIRYKCGRKTRHVIRKVKGLAQRIGLA